jgi:endonuclease YncB( thermonuclease family)
MSKRCRDVFFTTAVVIAVAFIVADNFALDPLRKYIVESKQRGPDGQKYHNKTFTVVNVVDGDTFDIDIPDNDQQATRIRPLGIDTPETVDPRQSIMHFGSEASEYAKQLLLNNDVKITIDTISRSRDNYNRLLCFVELSDGRDFGKVMIENGYAYADLRFENGKFDEYVLLQQQALENKIGLWKEVTKSQLPKWLKDRKPQLLDNR